MLGFTAWSTSSALDFVFVLFLMWSSYEVLAGLIHYVAQTASDWPSSCLCVLSTGVVYHYTCLIVSL